MTLDDEITTERYTDEVLRPVVCPLMSSRPDETVLQQDNVRLQAARFTARFRCICLPVLKFCPKVIWMSCNG